MVPATKYKRRKTQMMNIDILDEPLFKSLLDKTIPSHEIMSAFNVRTSIDFNIPASVLGFVYVSRKGNYHLILNGNANYEAQHKTFIHEIKHIAYDLPRAGYIIGLNMQHTGLECRANMIAEGIVRYIYKSMETCSKEDNYASQ